MSVSVSWEFIICKYSPPGTKERQREQHSIVASSIILAGAAMRLLPNYTSLKCMMVRDI